MRRVVGSIPRRLALRAAGWSLPLPHAPGARLVHSTYAITAPLSWWPLLCPCRPAAASPPATGGSFKVAKPPPAITLSDAALAHLTKLRDESDGEKIVLRMGVKSGGCRCAGRAGRGGGGMPPGHAGGSCPLRFLQRHGLKIYPSNLHSHSPLLCVRTAA